jgi:hypothetical protein
MNHEWNQSGLLRLLTFKKPITRAMANAIVQEVFDFIAVGLILGRGPVSLPRLGQFTIENGEIKFSPSAHLTNLVQAGHRNPRSLKESTTNG